MSKRMEVKEKEDGREDDIQTLLQLFNDLEIREERNNKETEKISKEEEGTAAISNTKGMEKRKGKNERHALTSQESMRQR